MTVDSAEPVCFIASSHCVERRYILESSFSYGDIFIIQMCFFLNPLRPPFLAVWPRAWNMKDFDSDGYYNSLLLPLRDGMTTWLCAAFTVSQ